MRSAHRASRAKQFRPGRFRSLRRIVFGCAALALAILITANYFLFYDAGIGLVFPGEVEKLLEEIRAAGEPVTLQELDEWYPTPPEDENAAIPMMRAFEAYRNDPELTRLMPHHGLDPGEIPLAGEAIPAEMLAAMEEFLALNRECLALATSAMGLAQSRFPVDLKLGYEAKPINLVKLRSVANLFAVQSMLGVEQDDPDSVVATLQSMIKMESLGEKEPLLLSQLARIAAAGAAFQAIEYAANSRILSSAQLGELSRLLEETEDRDLLQTALIGERALTLDFMAKSFMDFSALGLSFEYTGRRALDVLGFGRRSEIVFTASYYRRFLDGSRRADGDRQQELDQAQGWFEQEIASKAPRHALAALATFATSRANKDYEKYLAQHRLARTALRIEQFRLDTGGLPANLDELIPNYAESIPADPFNGQPLNYLPGDSGFTVHSVGEDLEDNLGERDPGASPKRGDLTFALREIGAG